MEPDHITSNNEEETSSSSLKDNLQQQINQVEERVEEARQMIEKYNQKVVDVVTDKPFVAIAGAFVAGYLIGKLAAHRWFV